MFVKIPNWLANSKEVNSENCRSIYKEKLSKKLAIAEYISLDQLRIEVQKSGIKNRTEYQQKRKPRWHSVPSKYYKDEWISWRDLFGNNYISLKKFRIEVQKMEIKNRTEYQHKRKPHWPSAPRDVYKGEWIDWYDLLGKTKVDISFRQLKIEVQKMRIKNGTEYKQKRKPNWPSTPDKHYKGEWIDWYDLLGKTKVDISFRQLKIEVQKIKIKNRTEYQQKRKPNWPSNPDKHYKEKWTDWYDLFGN
jgi:hypothetical protein